MCGGVVVGGKGERGRGVEGRMEGRRSEGGEGMVGWWREW